MAYVMLLTTIFIILVLVLDLPSPRQSYKSPSVKSRELYHIRKTYGPLILTESEELAWPHKQFISIKYPNDTYARWANVADIKDDQIKYIGTHADCWLRLENVSNSNIRAIHWGLVRSRGKYYIFEVHGHPISQNLDYDWWNHPYSQVDENVRVESGLMSLTVYRDEKPITIEGKNTNGVAVIEFDEEKSTQGNIIGSAPHCWITLPDPDLPPYLAIRDRRGHHRVLYEYYDYFDCLRNNGQKPEQYLTRADRSFEIGGYRITL